MLGAIAGDIIGSVYEHHNTKNYNFALFSGRCRATDDTYLTVAVADALLTGAPYAEKIKEYYRLDPGAGYGKKFKKWGNSDSLEPYNSLGNGSAMRVSPVAYAFNTLEEVLREAERSAECTHNHPEGIRGAQAVAAAVFWARTGSSQAEIRAGIESRFGYDLSESIASLRTYYEFDVTCAGSVPQAIIAFLESQDFEDAIRCAISIGGDSDTLACMTGAIAEAYYRGLPRAIQEFTLSRLPAPLLEVVQRFRERYGIG